MSEWGKSNRGGSTARYRGADGRTGRLNSRRVRAMVLAITACLCFGLLAPVVAGGSVSAAPAAADAPPAPMRLISTRVPAVASSSRGFPAGSANDIDYRTYWRSASVPAWLAYDLSSVPSGQRGNVVVAWYNDPITPDYNYTLGKSVPYNLPSAYTIEANAAGGGTVPGSGWVVLTTVTGNTYHSRQHALNLNGYNWVRINVSAVSGNGANRDVALNMDVHDASAGVQDSWIFYGDYISAGGMDHDPRQVGSFGQLMNNLNPSYFP